MATRLRAPTRLAPERRWAPGRHGASASWPPRPAPHSPRRGSSRSAARTRSGCACLRYSRLYPPSRLHGAPRLGVAAPSVTPLPDQGRAINPPSQLPKAEPSLSADQSRQLLPQPGHTEIVKRHEQHETEQERKPRSECPFLHLRLDRLPPHRLDDVENEM